ncbi:transglutaminase family protein [Rubinisphaera sp.]|uniref:transglutaminase-like domain-containing protein n=1 Tax=Rubinisphaera sp. TaxID=2024857 RepID=UPI000C0DC2E7|nr:transglutaminase family protein [Rubinisphaera sp.]MBV11987.1 transglutaminase [Rubinisphaera sp.]HCS55089.1 transglutaminase family protein [Planctomycetaceae bacterium]|tara:strand:+ start:10557 stop:11399 length:843 start_codon:yes stop_codon:yes gene_type:complete
MVRINVGCDLAYEVRSPTVFLFQIVAASNSYQQVFLEELNLNPSLIVERCQIGMAGNQLQRVVVEPCDFQVSYRGTVELSPQTQNSNSIGESLISQTPAEVLTYLNPSRYCESDLLSRFAFEEFGQLYPGYSRVQAICNWVFEQLDYTPGSTIATTTAADVLLQRTGVCRDYAHLAIALCRGLGIPARYVAGYALNLNPPDFHGFMEAFLDGQWYLFDPTRLTSTLGLVRIGTGRDAADVSVATITGNALLTHQSVWATLASENENPVDDGTGSSAVSTA